MKYLQTYDSFNENKITDLARRLGSKIGVVKLTDQEVEKKAKEILKDEEKLLKAIRLSTNPKLHMTNYTTLKNKDDKMSYYRFVVFLNDNIADLMNKRPVYYQITDFNINDTGVVPGFIGR